MEALRLLSEQVSLDDYPLLREVPRSSEVPGYILMEEFALQGIRNGVSMGCLATTAYFYLVRRSRLSFADRSLARLHQHLIPSIGYTTPLGALGGIIFGALNYEKEASPDLLQKKLENEISAAKRANDLRDRRRDAIIRSVREQQSVWSRWKVRLGYEKDPTEAALARYGLQQQFLWEETLSPLQFAFISLHSTPNNDGDTGKEKINKSKCIGNKEDGGKQSDKKKEMRDTLHRQILCSGKGSTGRGHRTEFLASHPNYRSTPYTTLQMDYLVSRALYYRLDETHDRWTTTSRRGGTCGIMAFWLLWNAKVSLLFRTSVGFGFGIAMGGLISSLRLDEAFVHLGDFN